MAIEEHLKILWQGVEAWNKWRIRISNEIPDLSGADLSGLELIGANLNKTILYGANLYSANLSGANLSRADLRASNLYGSEIGNANLSGADLREAKLIGAVLVGADFSSADLSGADFDNANLASANLSDTNLSRAKLRGADLAGVDLSRADLSGADLSNAIIGYTHFTALDLSKVKGLESLEHILPSSIDLDTLYQSGGKIPEEFLRGCGVPDEFITFLPSLIGARQAIQFYSCFISYSHKDEEIARRLHSRMRDEHLRVWFAPEDMKGGDKIYDQIERAIQLHDRLLLVLSDDSMKSEWVMTEIRKARRVEIREKRRKLFPIRLVDFERIREWQCFDADTGKDLAAEVREYFIPDFSDWKNHDNFEQGFARLLRDLKAEEEKSAK